MKVCETVEGSRSFMTVIQFDRLENKIPESYRQPCINKRLLCGAHLVVEGLHGQFKTSNELGTIGTKNTYEPINPAYLLEGYSDIKAEHHVR